MEKNGTSDWPVVKLFLTAQETDFHKERQHILLEILPDLREWCNEHKLDLQFTDLRWGRQHPEVDMIATLREIQESYYNNVMPVFINLTCESLGIIPLWGDAPDLVVKEYQTKLNMKDFEMELLYCAQRPDNVNCIYVVRDDSFLEALEGSIQFIQEDLVSRRSREYGQSIVSQLPSERIIKHSYRSVSWNEVSNSFSVVLDSRLLTQITERVKECLQRDLSQEDFSVLSLYQQQKDLHTTFMKSRSSKLKGRNDVLKQVEEYILHGDNDVPLVILGGAGSGKSSVMAKCVDVTQANINSGRYKGPENKPWRLFYHFVDAVPGSSHFAALLSRLLHQLDVVDESGIPTSVESASQLTCSALCSEDTKPILVFVDAVNQVDEECAATSLGWLPRKLAPQVRCILSLVNDCAQHKALMERERKAEEVHLLPLDAPSRKGIILESFSGSPTKLDETQMKALLANRSSENPLWLSIACERIKSLDFPLEHEINLYIKNLSSSLLCLFEQVLEELRCGCDGRLVSATLCLLHVSATGLLERELLQLLASKELTPPSPFDEKEDKESSEKETKQKKRVLSGGSLTQEKWRHVFCKIKPFLRPFGDSADGKMGFYHRTLHKAVRKVFFQVDSGNANSDESEQLYRFWHSKLADYFQHCTNLDRKTEEYLYHLSKLGDSERLSDCLCEWVIFDKLYHEEYSAKLLKYWRQAGGIDVMTNTYKHLLAELESQEPKNETQISLRYEHIARILLQAGKYTLSLELTKVAWKWEEKELGNRSDRIVELYSLMAEIYDEKLKLNDFVSASQIPALRKTISYGRKSIELRKALPGDYHKSKLGLSLMKLAFSLESWEACGGDATLSGTAALLEGNEHIDAALVIFKELKDVGHHAEALMTKGVLAPRGTMEQLKYYNDAMEISRQVYGEFSLLTSRLYINIGIVYEDNNDYVKAFEYFQKWAQVSEVVLGPEHPKTLRAKGVLKEPRYKLVAQRLKEQTDSPAQNNDETVEESINSQVGSQINREVEQLVDEFVLDDRNRLLCNIANDDEERHDDARDDGGNDADLSHINEELQHAINELLRRALGQLDNRAEILQNLLNTVNVPQPVIDSIAGVQQHGAEEEEENDDNEPEEPRDDDT